MTVPERESKALLEDIKKQIGSMAFAAQYLQEPTPPDGAVFKREWFRFFGWRRPGTRPARQDGDQIIQSWDVATTVRDSADWSVCTTWLTRDEHCYLLDVYRARLEFPALKQKAVQLAEQFGADAVLVESIGAGQSLYQELRGMTSLPIIPIKPEQSKEDRAVFASVAVESGQVVLHRDAAWLPEFFNEMLRFPRGKHDDVVDSATQFLVWHRKRTFRPTPPEVKLHIITGGPRFSRGDLISGLW